MFVVLVFAVTTSNHIQHFLLHVKYGYVKARKLLSSIIFNNFANSFLLDVLRKQQEEMSSQSCWKLYYSVIFLRFDIDFFNMSLMIIAVILLYRAFSTILNSESVFVLFFKDNHDVKIWNDFCSKLHTI